MTDEHEIRIRDILLQPNSMMSFLFGDPSERDWLHGFMLPLLAFSGIEFGACGSGLGGVVSGALGFLSWVGLRGSFSIGALILRIGFWGHYTIVIIRILPKIV